MTEKVKDYYAELGVDRSATLDEIKAAFRRLAAQFHPDRSKLRGDTEAVRKAKEERFKDASEAYTVLSDPEKRTEYDQTGSRPIGFDLGSIFNFADIFGFGAGDPFTHMGRRSARRVTRITNPTEAMKEWIAAGDWSSLRFIALGVEYCFKPGPAERESATAALRDHYVQTGDYASAKELINDFGDDEFSRIIKDVLSDIAAASVRDGRNLLDIATDNLVREKVRNSAADEILNQTANPHRIERLTMEDCTRHTRIKASRRLLSIHVSERSVLSIYEMPDFSLIPEEARAALSKVIKSETALEVRDGKYNALERKVNSWVSEIKLRGKDPSVLMEICSPHLEAAAAKAVENGTEFELEGVCKGKRCFDSAKRAAEAKLIGIKLDELKSKNILDPYFVYCCIRDCPVPEKVKNAAYLEMIRYRLERDELKAAIDICEYYHFPKDLKEAKQMIVDHIGLIVARPIVQDLKQLEAMASKLREVANLARHFDGDTSQRVNAALGTVETLLTLINAKETGYVRAFFNCKDETPEIRAFVDAELDGVLRRVAYNEGVLSPEAAREIATTISTEKFIPLRIEYGIAAFQAELAAVEGNGRFDSTLVDRAIRLYVKPFTSLEDLSIPELAREYSGLEAVRYATAETGLRDRVAQFKILGKFDDPIYTNGLPTLTSKAARKASAVRWKILFGSNNGLPAKLDELDKELARKFSEFSRNAGVELKVPTRAPKLVPVIKQAA